MDYAVIKTGGKQYTVHSGQTLDVELLEAEADTQLELDQVLLLSRDGQVTVGRPVVAGASVMATVVEHGKAPKIIVFKYKNKTRYQRKLGHRQRFTRIQIDEIRSA